MTDKTKASHTLGPWKTSTANGRFVMAGAMKVATATNTAQPPHAWANAKLIAAAPDLLEALQAVVKYNDNPNLEPGFSDELEIVCKSAIAKATGE